MMITDISGPLKAQQKISDQMYLDAIECNYSHEQMTPLNSILANAKIIYKRYLDLIKFQENSFRTNEDSNVIEQAKKDNLETLKLLKAIQQYGEIMWYYNQNQIQRIKIQKNEFKKNYKTNNLMEELIEKVINPFEPQINSRKIKILLCLDKIFEIGKVKFDLLMYQLILFNIIQNAVKYNKFEGNILIRVKLRPIYQGKELEQNTPINFQRKRIAGWNFDDLNFIETHVLETEIIDTGIGINSDRQKMLFVPFLELKTKQNLQEVKDNNIGMGLACSHSITKQFGGDIKLKISSRGLTVFAFKIPVYIENFDQINKIQDQQILQNECINLKKKGPKLLEIDKQTLQKQLQEYIDVNKLQNIKELLLEEIKLIQNSKAQIHVQKYIQNNESKSSKVFLNQKVNPQNYQSPNNQNYLIGENNQNQSYNGILPKKNRSNSVCQQFTPNNHSVKGSSNKSDIEILQFQIKQQPSLKKQKKKKKIKKISALNIISHYTPQIRQERSEFISQGSDHTFNEDDLDFEKYDQFKHQFEAGQSSNSKSSYLKQKEKDQNLQSSQQQVNFNLKNEPNSISANKSKQSFKNPFDPLNENAVQKYTNSQNVFLGQSKVSQLAKVQDYKQLKKMKSMKIISQNNEITKKQFSQQQQIFFRPCNQLLTSSHSMLFASDLNKLNRENKLLIARELLMGNHKDEIVNLFQQKAKQLTQPDKYKRLRGLDNFNSRRYQITLRNQKDFYVDLQVEKDSVFQMPVLYKNKQKFVSNQANPSSIKQRIVGLSSESNLQFDNDSKQKFKRNILSKSSLNYQNKTSKILQGDQRNRNMSQIVQRQGRQQNSSRNDDCDENSNLSCVYDILLDELPNKAKKKSNNLINDLQNKLKQNKRQQLGDEGVLWMKEKLQQKGIQSFIQSQEINDESQSLDSSFSNFDQKSFWSMETPRSSHSDQSIQINKAKINLQNQSVQLKIKDYKIFDGCMHLLDSNDNQNEVDQKSLSDNQQEIPQIKINDEHQNQVDKNFIKELEQQKKAKKKKQKKKKNIQNIHNFGGLRSIYEEQEEQIESLEFSQKAFNRLSSKIKNLSGQQHAIKLQQLKKSGSNSLESSIKSKISKSSLENSFKQFLQISQRNSQKLQKIVEEIKERTPVSKDKSINILSEEFQSQQLMSKQISCEDVDNNKNDQDPSIEVGDEEDQEDEQSEFSDCGCQPKVMIVDDIQFNILPIKYMLQDFTKNIHEAINGQIAVDLFKQALDNPCGCKNRAYKLIFMDLQMPVKDGYQASVDIFQLQNLANKLQSIIRRESASANAEKEVVECRIVVLTSYTSNSILERCLEIGCSEILNKPLVHEKLHQVMWKHFFRVEKNEYEKIYLEQFEKPYSGQF